MCAHLRKGEKNGFKQSRQMSVILRAAGSEPGARLAALHTRVSARGRPEATAVPGRCNAAGLVVTERQG